MADTPPETPSAPVLRSSKPASEALLNEKVRTVQLNSLSPLHPIESFEASR